MKNPMFKNIIENELMDSMQKQLISAQLEDHYKFDKLAKAIDYLNAAANIFEQNGLHKTAEEVTDILEDIVSEESDEHKESDASPEDIAEVVKKLTSSDITSEDLKNVFWSTPVGLQLAVLEKLYDIAKGTKEEGLFETLKKEFEKVDIRDPEVLEEFKDKISSRLSTGLKALKLMATFGLV